METIKVNMTPCEDVKTIHASQNDNEARQWGFELHNNGEKIDSSSISDQLVFKAYEGGTEEILPTNGSTPTTSPFLGDIKYPQGLLSDQEFLCRQSPTEKDGYAKITDIKGNTLVWNQLVQNGNFSDTSVWQNYGSTFTVSGNTATVKSTNASNQFGIYQPITVKANHKYFISFEAKKYGTITLKRNRFSSGQEQVQEGLYRTIETASADSTLSSPIRILFAEPVSDITNDYFMVKNYMIIDLTQMGLDITASEFTSLFPLPYYDYCKGAMLSFGGRNVKFNQLVEKGNMTDGWTFSNSTGGYSNNILTFTASAQNGFVRPDRPQYIYANHKYFATVDVKATSAFTGRIYFSGHNESFILDPDYTTTWKTFSLLFTNTVTEYNYYPRIFDTRDSGWDAIQIRNCMLIDLTEMFGAGNEPSAEGFLELFADDHYDYTTSQYMNLGQPVSLKTTGKNILQIMRTTSGTHNGITYVPSSDSITLNGTSTGLSYYVFASANGDYTLGYANTLISKGKTIKIASLPNNVTLNFRYTDGSYENWVQGRTITLTKDISVVYLQINNAGTSFSNVVVKPMITFADTEDQTFEPYTESTLSIPLDEFPNGMDGIGNIFDEKTENKTIQRLVHYKVTGEENVDRWVDNTSTVFSNHYGGVIDVPSLVNCMYDGNAIALASKGYQVKFANENKTIYLNSGGKLAIIDDSYTTQSAWLEGIKGLEVVFALRAENYVETASSTASLVTENTEIPLSNDDGVLIGKCTEQLSSESGFIDAKIKLADDDGECYSNKIQLHIERSPQ